MLPVNNYEYPESKASWNNNSQHVTIVEQPANLLRFRYECENRSAGRIVGEHSQPQRKTYPTIQIHGYKGPAVVVVSCVTRDNPPRAHPHSVMGKNSTVNGIYTMKVNVIEGLVSFIDLGVQCVKRTQVLDALDVRKRQNVDPFGTGFDHMSQPNSIDLNAIRLCFQVFVKGPENKYNLPLRPVLSHPIYDKKANEELIICKLSTCSAPISGGTEVILLCSKVSRDDVEVRFFQINRQLLFWEAFGDFQPIHVHKQVAIVFKTPPYCHQDVNEPVFVQIQLRKKSDGSTSQPLPFQLLPLDLEDPNTLKRKRTRFDPSPRSFMLRQMQIEAEKRSAILNQSLLLKNPDQHQQSAIFHSNPPENHQIPHVDFNIREPVPQPRFSLEKSDPSKLNKEQKRLPRKQTTPQARVQKSELPNVPEPQPRRRGTPPPNVTINSYAYRELLQKQLMGLERYPQFSDQQTTTMVNDSFAMDNLPSCEFDPRRGSRTLAVIKPSNRNDDNFDYSLTREDNGFQNNVQNLNRNVGEDQEINRMFANHQQINNGHNWNDVDQHVYDSVPDENDLFL